MSIRLGDEAPEFTQESIEGAINFHEWLGGSWGILFSHPAVFTPVCTTELGTVADLKSEFERRNVKPIALTVDPVDKHEGWAADIAETQGTAPNLPLIADADRKVSELYDMIHPEADATDAVWQEGDVRPSDECSVSRLPMLGCRRHGHRDSALPAN